MRRFLIVLLVIVVGLAALGHYLRWYEVSVGRDSQGRTEFKLVFDPDKVSSDAEKAEQRTKDALGRKTDREPAQ
jgi:hypothetical protein